MNSIILIGRVAAPPELRYTPNGKAVANFRLAVDRPGARKDGENNADFIPCQAWERTAEICNEFLTKGKQIAVQGRLQTRTYEDNEGKKRSAFDVVVDRMQMLGSKQDGQHEAGGGGGQQRQQQTARSGGGGHYQQDDLGMDDVPF